MNLSRYLLAFLLLFSLGIAAHAKELPAQVSSADGSAIAYGSQGQGEPALVFIHCWTCNHHFWDRQIAHFADKHQVIWLDLAGHGQSGSKRTDYSMAAFGSDVAAVVKKLDARKVVLVGHSMGGPVAVEAAKQLGDRVVGIVGVDTFYTPFVYPSEEEKVKGIVQPFEKDFAATSEAMVRSMFTPQADPQVVEKLVGEFKRADPVMGLSALYAIFDWQAKYAQEGLKRFEPILHNINAAPKGDEKPLHPNVVLIPGVGHFVAQVKPDAFNRVLEQILVGVK